MTAPARVIGNQAQAIFRLNISHHLTATAAYAHFFAGDFLKEFPPGQDVDYASAADPLLFIR